MKISLHLSANLVSPDLNDLKIDFLHPTPIIDPLISLLRFSRGHKAHHSGMFGSLDLFILLLLFAVISP